MLQSPFAAQAWSSLILNTRPTCLHLQRCDSAAVQRIASTHPQLSDCTARSNPSPTARHCKRLHLTVGPVAGTLQLVQAPALSSVDAQMPSLCAEQLCSSTHYLKSCHEEKGKCGGGGHGYRALPRKCCTRRRKKSIISKHLERAGCVVTPGHLYQKRDAACSRPLHCTAGPFVLMSS